MSDFILAYHGGNKPESPEAGAAAMEKWNAWLAGLGEAVVNPGTPLGKSKTISTAGIADDGGANPLNGFTVISADSIEAACEIAQSCPFLEMEGTIEVAEMMQMPGT